LFPRLKERRSNSAGVLSGGEQQMLTLARTMMGNPELVIIDEPTEGLAPMNRHAGSRFPAELKGRGTSICSSSRSSRSRWRSHSAFTVMGSWPNGLRGNADQPAQEQACPPGVAESDLGLVWGRSGKSPPSKIVRTFQCGAQTGRK